MRLRYYQDLNFPTLLDGYTGGNGFLVYKPWEGGFNNVRMSYELAMCLAFLTNKTLVMPHSYRIYLLKNVSSIGTYFDLTDTGVKQISLEELGKLLQIEPTYEAVAKAADYISPFKVEHNIIEFDFVPGMHKRWKPIPAQPIFDALLAYFPGNLLGNFDQVISTNRVLDMRRFVAKHIRYRDEIFDLAELGAQRIGEPFYSMHVRRGDFVQLPYIPKSETLPDTVRPLLTEGYPVYVATDERDMKYFDKLGREHRLIFYRELNLPEINPDWVPIVEQMMLAQGEKLIQAALSTLSSYAFRLRGYMQAADMNFYTTIDGYRESDQRSHFFDDRFSVEGTWVREFKETTQL